MPALDNNVRKLLGANAVTRPVDELTDTALIHFVWNFGKAQAILRPLLSTAEYGMALISDNSGVGWKRVR